MTERPCALYRHFAKDNTLLYVGCSLNAIIRLSAHRNSAPWYDQIVRQEIEWFETRSEALKAEAKAIKKERPKYNTQHTKPEWVEEVVGRPRIEVASLRSIYTIRGAADLLSVRPKDIEHLIRAGDLKAMVIPCRKGGNGKFKDTEWHETRITGYEIAEYMEYLEGQERASQS